MYYGYPCIYLSDPLSFLTTTCNETAGRDINAYYAKRAMDTEEYCRNILFAQAAEDKGIYQDGLPFNSYTLEAVYQITYTPGALPVYIRIPIPIWAGRMARRSGHPTHGIL